MGLSESGQLQSGRFHFMDNDRLDGHDPRVRQIATCTTLRYVTLHYTVSITSQHVTYIAYMTCICDITYIT